MANRNAAMSLSRNGLQEVHGSLGGGGEKDCEGMHRPRAAEQENRDGTQAA
jgi:hypothetical protein